MRPTSRARALLAAGSLVIALLMQSCSSVAQNQSSSPVIGPQGIALDAKSIGALSRQALEGSGEAARRLLLHYMMATADRAEARYWALVAAENGDVVGQYNAGFLLKDDPDPRNRQRAIFWLKKAAIAGHPLAADLLSEISSGKRE